eukprot:1610910-Rhodomonas_salina.1
MGVRRLLPGRYLAVHDDAAVPHCACFSERCPICLCYRYRMPGTYIENAATRLWRSVAGSSGLCSSRDQMTAGAA